MSRLIFLVIKTGVAVLLTTSFLTSPGCRNEQGNNKEITKIPVRTIIVNETNIAFPVRSTGILSKKSEIKLSFKTGGIISGILIDEGQEAKKDEIMARLDLSEIRAQANQAKLSSQKARRDFTRVSNLYRDSVATLEQYQNAHTALEVAKNQNSIAEFNLKYSFIRAPADGRVLKRLAETNEIIAPGHPVFLFSSLKNDWVLRSNLADRDVVRLQHFDTASVIFDAFPGKIFHAEVSEIGEWADPYTGTYEVELRLLSEDKLLMSGLVGKAEIFPSETEKLIMIPAGALVHGKGRSGLVYVVKAGRPELTEITFSKIASDSLAVIKGLEAGNELITEGNYFIDSQSEIEIVK